MFDRQVNRVPEPNDPMRRPTFLRWRDWSVPQTVLVAIVGAVSILLVTVLASRVALMMAHQSEARLIERLGDVYLDGLSASVAPFAEAGSHDRLASALERVATYHDGVREMRIVVRDARGTIIGDIARDDIAAATTPPPVDTEVPLTIESARNRRWVQRPLVLADGSRAVIAAQLDLTPLREERLSANILTLVVNLLLAAALSGAAFVVMRRLLAPLDLFERALDRASRGEPRPIPLAGERMNRRIRRLVRAYNRMARAVADRRKLHAVGAEHLRAADLGRLAATIAHEVRNPLAGMLNAVDTARRFPENRPAVAQSLDLLQRGLEAIARVVDTTLSLYRPPSRSTALRQVDFDDLERLIRPVAARQHVDLDWTSAIAGPMPIDGSLIRQLVLNLTLNAINASPAQGRVSVDVAAADAGLSLRIEDEGRGLDETVAARIEKLDMDWIDTSEGGIGLGVVIRAVVALGGHIRVARSDATGGTVITVTVPAARSATASKEQETRA
jgi:signal transduction histidine kinase